MTDTINRFFISFSESLKFSCLFTGVVALISSWFVHVFYCIETDQWGFLIAGALAFPIAMVHGFWVMFTSAIFWSIAALLILLVALIITFIDLK